MESALADYAAGVPVKTIVHRHQVAESTLRRALARAGIGGDRRVVSPARRAAIAADYVAGELVKVICARHRCKEQTVHAIARALDLPPRKPRRGHQLLVEVLL